MHNALTAVTLGVIFNVEVSSVFGQSLNLNAAFFVLDAVHAVFRRWNVVIDNSQRLFRMTHLTTCHTQTFKSLRACHFVHKMAINIKEAGTIVLLIHYMVVPDLVIKCTRRAHCEVPLNGS